MGNNSITILRNLCYTFIFVTSGPSRWIHRMSIILRLDVFLLTSLKGSAISQSCFWRVVIPDVSWTRTKSGVSLIFKRFLNFHWLTKVFDSKVWVLEVFHERYMRLSSAAIFLSVLEMCQFLLTFPPLTIWIWKTECIASCLSKCLGSGRGHSFIFLSVFGLAMILREISW